MKSKFLFKSLTLFFFSFLLCSCNKEEVDGTLEIDCHRTVMLGEWDVSVENSQYYIELDSIVESTNTFTAILNHDGTGLTGKENFLSDMTWMLQCNPSVLLINRLSEIPLEDNPMSYIALSNIYQVNKITHDEIKMTSEYFLGSNETRRKVTENITYTRIE